MNEESFEAGLSRLERQVALKQAKARGFFTYTDLTAACDQTLTAELLRALTAAATACLALTAALLTTALVVSHAWLPALRLAAVRSSDLALDTIISPSEYRSSPPTFLNNSTVDFTIDALADRLEATERLKCCAEWTRHRGHRAKAPTWNRRAELERMVEPWWSRTSALSWLYWGTLVSPVQRWLERVAEYAELARTSIIEASHDERRCDGHVAREYRASQHCVHQWLNLSKLSALLATVSDR